MGELALKDRVDAVDLPGQLGLPGTGAPKCQVLANVRHEDFCQEYVKNGNNGRAAYRAAMNADVSDATADASASRLLRSDKIAARIAAIREGLRRQWDVTQADIMEFHGRVLKTDRRKFFDDKGRRIPTHELPPDLEAIVDLESTFSKDYGVVLLPAVASRAKSADALARMMGLDKTKMELTGKDGGPVQSRVVVDDIGRLQSLKEKAQALKDAGVIS